MRATRWAIALGLIPALAGSASAALINVDFGGGAVQSGPALVGSAGDVWNAVTSSASNAAVQYADGSSSPVTLSSTITGNWSLGNAAPTYGTNFYQTPYLNLMQDFTVGTGTITFAGLPADTAMALYVYSQANQEGGLRSISVTSGAANATISTDPTLGVFVAGQNYALLNVMTDASGSLTVSVAQVSGETDVNGLQLVTAVPEPASLGLLGLGALALLRPR